MRLKRGFVVFVICAVVGLIGFGWIYFDSLGISDMPLAELKAKYEEADSSYMTVDNTQVHYCDSGGDGQVIVALHGICDALQTWDEWTEAMKGRYRIVRPDLPGFGLTGPAADGDYSKEAYVAFLEDFLRKLKIEKCILIGNSLGGAIAWNYALSYPERIERLILVDPAGYPLTLPGPLKIVSTPVLRQISKWIAPKFIFRLSVKQVFGDSSKITDDIVDRFYELNLRPGNRQALMDIVAAISQLNDDPGFSRRIRNIAVPTLLLWGKEDRWIPVSQAQQWQADVKDLKAIIYEGVGHVPQMEIPAKCAQDVDQWLTSEMSSDQCDLSWLIMIGAVIVGFIIGMLVFRNRGAA